MTNQNILKQIIEYKEETDIKEVAQKLSSGDWIAICATLTKPMEFCLGRINQPLQGDQENK